MNNPKAVEVLRNCLPDYVEAIGEQAAMLSEMKIGDLLAVSVIGMISDAVQARKVIDEIFEALALL